jgi:hypothetical protein
MTTGSGPDRSDRRRPAWELGLDPAASPDEARAAFLRLLDEADFVPPASWRRAWQALDRTAAPKHVTPAEGEISEEEEDRLRGGVVAFAGSFWGLPLGERRERWRELAECCGPVPPLRAWLRQLVPALPVEAAVPAPDDPLAGRLAEQVQQLFVLPTPARTVQRQEFLRQLQEPAAWRSAARRLRKRLPALAALQADLLDAVESWERRQRRLAALHRQVQRAQRALAGSARIKLPIWVISLLAAAINVGLGIVGIVTQPPGSEHRSPAATQHGPQPGNSRIPWRNSNSSRSGPADPTGKAPP